MSLKLGYYTDEEMELLSIETGLSIEAIKAAQEAYILSNPISLETPLLFNNGDESEEVTLWGIFGEDRVTPTPEESFMEKAQNEEIHRILEEYLGARDFLIIELRFGLKDGHPKTLGEIGQMFGLTRERIRQVEKRALLRLRRIFKSYGRNKWDLE